MINKIKVINFLQDFGCARLDQLQILFNAPGDNFRNILSTNLVSRKGDIFVHNTKKIDEKMLAAIGVLCKYKKRLVNYYKGYEFVYITFLTKDNLLYNIIVTDKENEQGLLKLLRNNSQYISDADRFILLFQDDSCFYDIKCDTPYVYCIYPSLDILSTEETEDDEENELNT